MQLPLLQGLFVAVIATIIWLVYTVIYRIYFHPLSKYPGPKLAACSHFWFIRTWSSGFYHQRMDELHRKYGDIVRISTNELSFRSPTAFKDIYNHVSKDKPVFPKSDYMYMRDPSVKRHDIVFVKDPQDHRAQRKTLSHAFSAKALRDNEESVQVHVKLLLDRLEHRAGPGSDGANMCDVFNWLTFDIIGDLAFGESFNSVSNWEASIWVSLILSFLYQATFMPLLNRLGIPISLFENIIPKSMKDKLDHHDRLTMEKVKRRVEMGSTRDREDFFTHLLQREKGELDLMWLREQAKILILAGSETTANLMAGATLYLCRNPDKMAKLQHEIRSAFSSRDEITGDSTANLEYFNAVIEESLRIFPPVPFGLPRVSTGGTVDGHYIPAGTVVSVDNWATTHDERNFSRPREFIPERWIGEGFGDRKEASRPFTLGPRGCLGINLAYMEARITLASLVYAFDWEMVNTELDWDKDMRFYTAWQKPKLMVRYRPHAEEKSY